MSQPNFKGGLVLRKPENLPPFSRVMKGSSQILQRFYKLGPVLDQGDTQECGGYAAEALLSSEPIIQSISGSVIYSRCKELDNYPGEGTTMDGVIAALKSFEAITQGYITENPQEIYQYVGNISPVLVALDWRQGMMKTDPDGFVKFKGDSIGGHCFLCWGVDVTSKILFFRNSWGAEFGIHGNFYMTFKEFEKAFAGNGIAAAVKEVKI